MAFINQSDRKTVQKETAMKINYNLDEGVFDTEVNGYKAFVRFNIYEGCLDIRQTVVPKAIGGRGIAAALVKEAYDYAQRQHLRCVATCSYAVVWLERHPEYEGERSKDYVEGACAI